MSVGLEVAIEKRQETDEAVVYVFFVREGRGGPVVPKATGRPGSVSVERGSGEVKLLEPCPDDLDGGVLFSRVVAVLKRHWKSGVFPAVTWWAG